MECSDTEVQWTEEQCNLVQQTVRDEARKVRVAASFLPLYGPLPPDAASVPLQHLEEIPRRAGIRMRVDDSHTRPLTTISVNVELQSSQAAQPDLSSALIMFRRAANIIARVEDRIVFEGQPGPDPDPRLLNVTPIIFTVSGGEQFKGLIREAQSRGNYVKVPPNSSGGILVTKVAEAIEKLEKKGHLQPFALVLGGGLFIMAHTPNERSLVLPADRIKPLLDGPLLRSGTIADPEGVIVSLAGDPVDLVVARDISVQFLQITTEPRHIYRVSQRFTLRIKQYDAFMAILPNDV